MRLVWVIITGDGHDWLKLMGIEFFFLVLALFASSTWRLRDDSNYPCSFTSTGPVRLLMNDSAVSRLFCRSRITWGTSSASGTYRNGGCHASLSSTSFILNLRFMTFFALRPLSFCPNGNLPSYRFEMFARGIGSNSVCVHILLELLARVAILNLTVMGFLALGVLWSSRVLWLVCWFF
jgi:hypothetical protein